MISIAHGAASALITAADAPTVPGTAKPLPDRTAAVFIAVVFIVILARLLGRLFRRIGQPPVIGEIIAGILLGTSLLGQFHHGDRTLTTILFPADVKQIMQVLANLGLVIFMFIIGLELDLKLIRGNERKAGVISLSSILVPFVGGALLALYLYNKHSQGGLLPGEHVKRLAFALFIGASMCVTAFPVLARILSERGMTRTPLGVIALACAAIDDVVAWSLLAVVSAIAAPGDEPLWHTFAFSLLYLIVMFGAIRPLLNRFLVPIYQKAGRLTPDVLAFLLVGLILSAYITDEIGIHFIFGAFVFGVIVPREGTHRLFQEILERLEQVSVLLLLPIFFIVTGLSVDLTKLTGNAAEELVFVLLVAIGGKFIGAYLAARAQRIPNRRSQALALLMNTRGLTELVLLSVGLRLKVLDVELFTMLVVMAVITTVMTAPLLRLVYPDKLVAREVEEAERAALGIPNAYRVMVVLGDTPRDAPLVDLAGDLAASEQPSQVVLSLFRPQSPPALEVGSGLSVELLEMAGVMGELEQLADALRGRGVDCVVLSRFSADPTGDAISQAAGLGADVLLVSATADVDRERLLREVEITVAHYEGDAAIADAPVPVTGLAHSGESADAALALAVRLSAGRRATLHLADDGSRRRVGGLAERLQRLGLAVEVVSADMPAAGLVLLAADAPLPAGATAALRVRAPQLQDSTELIRLLEAGTPFPAAAATPSV